MITLDKLANEMKGYTARRTPREEGAYFALRSLLIESMPSIEAVVYVYVSSGNRTTASHVSGDLEISLQHASTVLKRLADWGLLSRNLVTDTMGQRFEYREDVSGKE